MYFFPIRFRNECTNNVMTHEGTTIYAIKYSNINTITVEHVRSSLFAWLLVHDMENNMVIILYLKGFGHIFKFLSYPWNSSYYRPGMSNFKLLVKGQFLDL